MNLTRLPNGPNAPSLGYPKVAKILFLTPPSPRRAAAHDAIEQRVGEKLSPTAQTIFAGMYITHALPMAVWCTLRHAVAGCEFTSKLGLS